MIKEILTYDKNKELLTKKSQEADINAEETPVVIQDLKDTLASQEYGVGISAIQLGVPLRICVIKYNNQIYSLINPVITKTRGEVEFTEGCLSVPELSVTTKRAQKVWCEYTDENGRKKELADGGLCSVIIQHELDHFEGNCPLFARYEEVHTNE